MAIVNNPTLINCDGVYNILFKSDVPWSARPRWEPGFQKNVSYYIAGSDLKLKIVNASKG